MTKLDADTYLEFCKKTTKFLFDSQVIASNQLIILDLNNNDYLNAPPNMVGAGSFTTKLIRRDRNAYTYYVFCLKAQQKLCLYVGITKDFAQAKGPFFEGAYFRTYFDKGINWNEPGIDSSANRASSILNKVNRYGRLLFKEVCSSLRGHNRKHMARLALGGINLFQLLLHAIGARLFWKIHSVERYPGITWKVKSTTKGEVHLQSYDKGGIFDNYINSEAVYMPPQVMANYYADAYSAYCFARMFQLHSDKSYLEAADLALEFIERTYKYNITKDFKNPAFIETLSIISGHITKAKFEAYKALAKNLRSYHYNPTNVYALRYFWIVAQSYFRFHDKSPRKLSRLLRRISDDQLDDGLIRDNNYGWLYFSSHDLTYHQYTLACLACAIDYTDNEDLRRIFLKGCEFSLCCLTPDGEVSYMGRGSNNIYHIASAIYAFKSASTMLKDTNPRLAGAYKKGARLLFRYLKRAQRSDGMMPTAINDCVDRRVAWNHCETPYNGLVCYLLLKANDTVENDVKESPIPMESTSLAKTFDESGFVFVTNKKYYACFFAGCEKSYAWSSENHFSGAPGLCTVGVSGAGCLTPVLDGRLTDIPFRGDNPCGRGTFKIINSNPWILKYKREFGRWYLFLDDGIVVFTSMKDMEYLLSAPTRNDNNWQLKFDEISFNGLNFPRIESSNGRHGIVYIPIFCSHEYSRTYTCEDALNPRGEAKLVRFGGIRGSGAVSSAYLMIPFNGEARIPNITFRCERDTFSFHIGKVRGLYRYQNKTIQLN